MTTDNGRGRRRRGFALLAITLALGAGLWWTPAARCAALTPLIAEGPPGLALWCLRRLDGAGEAAVPAALAAALREEEPNRSEGRAILFEFGAAAGREIRALLRQGSESERLKAFELAMALRQVSEESCFPAAFELLREPGAAPAVRLAAARYLQSCDDALLTEGAFDEDKESLGPAQARSARLARYRELGFERFLASLSALLEGEDVALQIAALKLAAGLGPEARPLAPSLPSLLDAKRPERALAALELLIAVTPATGLRRGEPAPAALRESLAALSGDIEPPRLRDKALEAIGRLGPGARSLAPGLIRAMKDPGSVPLEAFAEALAACDPSAASDADLAELLKHPDPGARAFALWTSYHRNPRGGPRLLEALSGLGLGELDRAAEAILTRLGARARSILSDRGEEGIPAPGQGRLIAKVLQVSGPLEPRQAPFLAALLRSGDEELVALALPKLAAIDGRVGAEAMIAWLRSEDPRSWSSGALAVLSLCRQGNPALELLGEVEDGLEGRIRRALSSEDGAAQDSVIAEVLRRLDPQSDRPPLASWLPALVALTRRRGAAARERVLPELAALTLDGEPSAACALAALGADDDACLQAYLRLTQDRVGSNDGSSVALCRGLILLSARSKPSMEAPGLAAEVLLNALGELDDDAALARAEIYQALAQLAGYAAARSAIAASIPSATWAVPDDLASEDEKRARMALLARFPREVAATLKGPGPEDMSAIEQGLTRFDIGCFLESAPAELILSGLRLPQSGHFDEPASMIYRRLLPRVLDLLRRPGLAEARPELVEAIAAFAVEAYSASIYDVAARYELHEIRRVLEARGGWPQGR